MIDPVIFTIKLFGREFPVFWYGILIGLAVIVGAYVAEREVKRRGGPLDFIWDMMLWVIPAGIIGARLGYVLNDIAGGSRYFLDDLGRIFDIRQGGLHIYGAVALGLLVAYWYARRNAFDIWLLLDALAPALLIGQAVGRPANFINQELYGPPTDLSWGIPIAGENRLGPWQDLAQYPEDSTRFHPTFAYEIVWNLLAAGLILWLTRKFPKKFKPGAAFFMWLLLEGVGRFIIEYFRPDQPRIAGTDFSYSRLVAALMALAGGILLMVRSGKLKLAFLRPGPENYKLKKSRKSRRW